jgi:hypothetical protein
MKKYLAAFVDLKSVDMQTKGGLISGGFEPACFLLLIQMADFDTLAPSLGRP